MSFAFNTRGAPMRMLVRMTTDPLGRTPSAPHPQWPPGPPAGLTGWSLLRQMSRDMLGALDAWRQRYGDVFCLRIRPEREIVVTDPFLARELLKRDADTQVRWERGMRVFESIQGHSVFVAEGEAWQRKRHALQPTFSHRAVQGFVAAIADATDRALEDWAKRGAAYAETWPIETSLTALSMDIIVRLLFSTSIGAEARVAERDVHALLVAVNAEAYWPASWPDWMPWKRAKRGARRRLFAWIDAQVRNRLQRPQQAWPDDLLTQLLHAHLADPAAWPLDAVRSECMTIFLAGHETTAATLTWWAWCMAAHPGEQARAHAEVARRLDGRAPDARTPGELGYLTQTLQETLRLYAAAPVLNTRRTTAPTELGPWRFPARTLFLLPVQLMQRDARWFAEPLAFRPARFGADAPKIPRGAWMPFGAGPRVCLGQHLAMTEMILVAARLLQRFELSVPAGAVAPKPVMAISLRPDKPLRLTLRERAHRAG